MRGELSQCSPPKARRSILRWWTLRLGVCSVTSHIGNQRNVVHQPIFRKYLTMKGVEGTPPTKPIFFWELVMRISTRTTHLPKIMKGALFIIFAIYPASQNRFSDTIRHYVTFAKPSTINIAHSINRTKRTGQHAPEITKVGKLLFLKIFIFYLFWWKN